jgi:DNA topoisomerase-1
MLDENFDSIMNIGFTAKMESELDKIAETDTNWKEFLAEFWKEFFPKVEKAEKEAHVPKVLTEKLCPDCGHKLQKIWSRDKYFYGCSNYPDCKYTAPLEELVINKEEYSDDFNWDQSCPKCESPMKPRKSRFGIFLGCVNYPECKGIINIPKKGEPLAQNLPPCPAIGCEGHIVAKRSRFGKTFFSCSSFPDCNVISNSVEELQEKYQNHPKTPYEKKSKFKGKGKTTETSAKTKAKSKTKRKSPTKKEAKPTRKQPAYQLSPELASLLKAKELSRPDVTKGLWDYIKKHDLQDQNNKRTIIPDKALATIFGSPAPIDMMKLAGIISKHIVNNKNDV